MSCVIPAGYLTSSRCAATGCLPHTGQPISQPCSNSVIVPGRKYSTTPSKSISIWRVVNGRGNRKGHVSLQTPIPSRFSHLPRRPPRTRLAVNPTNHPPSRSPREQATARRRACGISPHTTHHTHPTRHPSLVITTSTTKGYDDTQPFHLACQLLQTTPTKIPPPSPPIPLRGRARQPLISLVRLTLNAPQRKQKTNSIPTLPNPPESSLPHP